METLRTSSYMIPVRLEKEAGKYMLIHGYTGAVDIVSEELLAKIKSVSSGNDFSESTLQTLLKRGYVTTKTQEEEYAYVARMARALHRKFNVLYTKFTWVVTYNCNFRCPYCFEGRGKKDGKRRFVFTKEQVDIAYKAQDIIQPCKKLRNNTITLYGGEPLLAENKDVVNYLVKKGIEKGYKFKAVTNGYEVEHYTNLLGEDSIYKLQITIDGPEEIHNKRRIHYKGYNTFDKIIKNIELALKMGVQINIRMNSDNENIEQSLKLKDYFNENKFSENPNFCFYLGILRDNRYIANKRFETLSAESFIEKQKQYGVNYREDKMVLYQNIYNALVNQLPIPFTSVSCSAQIHGNILDPLGNIYPCWDVVGREKYIKGSYSEDGVTWNKNVVNEWQNTNISCSESCYHCKYALLCGGGCPYYRHLNDNKDCLMFKSLFDLIVNKAYADLNIV